MPRQQSIMPWGLDISSQGCNALATHGESLERIDPFQGFWFMALAKP